MRQKDYSAVGAIVSELDRRARVYGYDALRDAVRARIPREKADALARVREPVSEQLLWLSEQTRTEALSKLTRRDLPVFLWLLHYHARCAAHLMGMIAGVEMYAAHQRPMIVASLHIWAYWADKPVALWPKEWGAEPW